MRLLPIFGLATVYFIAGHLALFLAPTLGCSSQIWPSAGIALTGILIYGYRVWLGILLGAFLINGLNPVTAIFSSGNFSSLLAPLFISMGASLQALGGAYLVKRYAGFPNPLNEPRKIVLFLVFGGLLSALINSTVSTLALVGFSLISSEALLTEWLSWYLGDVFGIIIFSPLALVWLQPTNNISGNRRVIITLPVLLTFILTSIFIYTDQIASKQRTQSRFDLRAQELNSTLAHSIREHTNALHGLISLYDTSSQVTREAFHRYTLHQLAEFRGIQALEWAPVVQAHEREAFEKSFQRADYPHFQITERGANKTMPRGMPRPFYVPITFMEPYQGNESAWGFDLASNPERLVALTRAADTGELSLTAPVTLVQEQGTQQGIVAYMPIYHSLNPTQTVEQRRNTLVGYFVGIFRVGDVIETAFQTANTEGLSFRLIDQTTPAAEKLLFTNVSDEPKSPVLQNKILLYNPVIQFNASSLSVGGRSWRLEIIPSSSYLAAHGGNNSTLIILVGLLLTSLMSVLSLIGTGRSQMFKEKISRHTTELEYQQMITKAFLHEKVQAYTKLDLLLNSTGEGIYGIGLDGTCTFANHAALTMLGYASQEEVIGCNMHELIHYAHANGTPLEISECHIHHTLLSQNSQLVDTEVFWRKNGSSFPVQYQARPILENEQIIGSVINFYDITERIESQFEIKKLLQALEQSPVSTVITDLNARIEYVNQQYIDSCGYTREEIIGSNPRFFQSGHTPEDTYNGLWAKLKNGGHWQGEFYNKTKQGVDYLEWVFISPIRDASGTITHYLSVIQDITLRKQYEEGILVAKEQAEALALSKMQFLANMSHEIRAPINAIMSIAFLALQTDLSAQQQHYMSQINSSAKWLLGILDDILNFSKLEAGKVELEQHPFELYAVITFLKTVATPLLTDKDVNLIFEVAPLVPSTFIGDALRLEQVLLNLISNAIKFTHTGSVTLEVQLLSLEDKQASLNFSVTDTGIGLDMNHKNKLFEAFNQADNSTTRLYGGTGLGLSISKQLVSAMGGHICIESQEDSGSCFSFTITLEIAPPLFVPCAKTSLKHDVKYPKLINARILVVEDNLIIQEFIPDIMEHEGMQVDLANNGFEALTLLAGHNEYAAVLMDCQMPVMDGYEATKRIRTNPRFDTLPIIAMSGNVNSVDQQRCLDYGMNDFISKPVDWEHAFLVLNKWINKD